MSQDLLVMIAVPLAAGVLAALLIFRRAVSTRRQQVRRAKRMAHQRVWDAIYGHRRHARITYVDEAVVGAKLQPRSPAASRAQAPTERRADQPNISRPA